jgi:hypothetical protein
MSETTHDVITSALAADDGELRGQRSGSLAKVD